MADDNALGEFLKARRALVHPEAAGVAHVGRRRVPGLRRDELAMLAGVSEPYLTRLEQGRDRHPSDQVLQALARALELDDGTTAHLYELARNAVAPPATRRGPRRRLERPAPGLQQLLDGWSDAPAYVTGRWFDVLAANRLATAIAPFYRPGTNLLRAIFLEEDSRSVFLDWPSIARDAVAGLRGAAGSELDDPALRELVGELSLRSEDFRHLWARHDARSTRGQTKRFAHPLVGRLELRRHAFNVADGDGHVLLAYTAEPGSPSANALALLSAMTADATSTVASDAA